jgi:hypothetical protein
MAMETTLSLSKPWPDFLTAIDAKLSQEVNLHCLGGFVLTALYDIPRVTGDLDYIEVVPRAAAKELEEIAGKESALSKKYRLFLQHVGIADLPDEHESRLQELNLGMVRLKLWALDPYDLLLAKLPRNSPKDQDDAKYLIPKIKLDLATFSDRWNKEMAPWISNRPRHDLTVELWKEYFQH